MAQRGTRPQGGAAQSSAADLAARYGPHYQWYAILAVICGLVAVVFSSTIANVALPELMRAFHIGEDEVQWVATGFQVTASTFILPTVWLMSRFGTRATYLGTLLLFVAVSVMGALSATSTVLFASRVLLGICMGVIPSLSMITVLRQFPPQAAGMAMGVFGMCAVATPAISPVVGGVFIQHFGWPAIFLLPLPFAVAGILLAIKFLPGIEERAAGDRFDWCGLLLISVLLVALLSIGQLGYRHGWQSAQAMACAAAALMCLAGFLLRQARVKQPLFDMRVFRNPRFVAATLVAVLYNVGSLGSVYLLVLFAQTAGGYSPSLSGSLMLPGGVALVALIGMAGKLTDRVEPRFVLMTGLGLFALSSYCFTGAQGSTPFWTLAAWLLMARCGLAFVVPALSVAAIEAVDRPFMAHASMYINFATQLGGAVGINGLAILYQQRALEHARGLALLPGGDGGLLVRAKTLAFHDCFWMLGIAYGVAMLLAWWIRKPAHRLVSATQSELLDG